jgi:hypothetical protein
MVRTTLLAALLFAACGGEEDYPMTPAYPVAEISQRTNGDITCHGASTAETAMVPGTGVFVLCTWHCVALPTLLGPHDYQMLVQLTLDEQDRWFWVLVDEQATPRTDTICADYAIEQQ